MKNPHTHRLPVAVIAIAALFAAGCRRAPPPSPRPAEAPPGAAKRGEDVVVLDALSRDGTCELGHEGAVIDFGEPSPSGEGTTGNKESRDVIERDGATWERVQSHSLAGAFLWGLSPGEDADANREAQASFDVDIRLLPGAARSLTVSVNGRVIGTAQIRKGPAKVVTVHAERLSLVPGRNDLIVQFHGASRTATEPQAEVDWIHIGAGDSKDNIVAPTWADTLISPSLGGIARKAVALTAPSYLRCVGFIPSGGHVRASLGVAGTGSGDVVVRLLRDHAPAIVLAEEHIEGGKGAAWKQLEAAIPANAEGALGAIEFDVNRSSKGTRVLIGEPRVTTPKAAPEGPAAHPSRGVLLVALGGTSRDTLAPYGGPRKVPELALLADSGYLFRDHRAVGPLASTALASMLTGTPPEEHGLVGLERALPKTLTTVAEAARQAGISTAMFTANPLSSSAFGFNRAWETFVERSPAEPGHATQVYEDAAQWMERHKADPFFIVVHARGGHPPWDVPSSRMPTLLPQDYTGVVEPRHIAELVARSKKFPTRFTDDDRTRAWAFYAAAMDEHDAALGRLLGTLRALGRDDGTTIIVTGDVGIDSGAPMPFGEIDSLTEERLAIPLIVRPGQKLPRGEVSNVPTRSYDVGTTVLEAFGLDAPKTFRGLDLPTLARAGGASRVRPSLATMPPFYAARWGAFVLSGSLGKDSRLCDKTLDRECVTDARGTAPLAFMSLERFAENALRRQKVALAAPSHSTVPPEVTAALGVWGFPVHIQK